MVLITSDNTSTSAMQNLSWESNNRSPSQEMIHLLEAESSLSCSQGPATGPYCESVHIRWFIKL
jgi:hypothetical protein